MGASTIVVAREDLSIPGADAGNAAAGAAADIETHFFNIVGQYNPDVIVLDLTGPHDNGIATILKIRRRSAVPILVICGCDDPMLREYCLSGAAECMQAPVDIMQIHLTVQKIIQLSKASRPLAATRQSQTQPLFFAGMTLHPHENLLIRADGATIKLTTSENRVLLHFVSNPWTLCTRDALADTLYGPHRRRRHRDAAAQEDRVPWRVCRAASDQDRIPSRLYVRGGGFGGRPCHGPAGGSAATRAHRLTAATRCSTLLGRLPAVRAS